MHVRVVLAAAVVLWSGAGMAWADEVVRIAYMDPLSGSLAATGQLGERHFRFAIDGVNAAQAAGPGRRLELVPMDNEVSPEKSLTLLRKAIDDGIHYVTQGNGSAVGFALEDAISKNNRRNPSQVMLYLNYAATDPGMTNEKCSWWHFRFDADSDMKMKAMADYLVSQRDTHKVYIFNPDYSFGVSVEKAARAMLANRRPDLQVVGAERVPLGKVKDFTPYIAKMQGAGADAVVTGNWGADLELLVKAAADSGYKGKFYTYYLGTEEIVTAAGKSAAGDVQVSDWTANLDVPAIDDLAVQYEAKYHDAFADWFVVLEIDMLAAAMKQANSSDPVAVSRALSGMKWDSPLGSVTMRGDNHQLLQPIYISDLEPDVPRTYKEVGLGFKPIGRIEADATKLPTVCKFRDAP